MRVEIFVQARMGSTRLPGKVLKPLMDKPLLHYMIERLKRITQSDVSVILTSHAPKDDVIVELCQQEGIPFFRGPEDDVLARYYEAAVHRRPDVIVRLTADCPLLDPTIVDKVIGVYRNEFPKWDYVSTCYTKRHLPRGLDVEVFSFEALERAFREAVDAAEREHVTLYLYRHPEIFRLRQVEMPTDLSRYRLTVDTIEDFELITHIYEALYPSNPHFNLQDIIALLQQVPDLAKLNAHIQQKPL